VFSAIYAVRNLGKGLTITFYRFVVRTFLEQREQCLKLVRVVMVRWSAVMEQARLRMSRVGFSFFGFGQL